MEFDSTEEGVSSIEQYYQQIEETFDFLPEQVKTSFMAAKVRQSVTQGKDEFFQNSPRAKKIKTIVNLTEDLADDDRSRIISDAVTFYLSQKKAENNVADLKPAARQACIATDEQQEITTFDVGKNKTINETLKIDATDEQQQITTFDVGTNININGTLMIDSNPPGYGNDTTTTNDVSESIHIHVFAALDFIGPETTFAKSHIANGRNPHVTEGWYIRAHKCYEQTCISKF
jgi:flagellar basal body-associated protein FliL